MLKQQFIRAGGAVDRFSRVELLPGDVADERTLMDSGELRTADVIIHAAADTRFTAGSSVHARINTDGTQNMLAFARRCPDLRRFVQVSTVCVAGTRTGMIEESINPSPPTFLNSYEESKWHAEQLVAASGVPASIIRLSVVAGSRRDGSVFRMGALHHAVRWLYRGLIPMIPGTADSRIDLISSESAADGIVRAALADAAPPVAHVCAGRDAVLLSSLIDCAVEHFADISPRWQRGLLTRPMIVDELTFELFRQSVVRSGDKLFGSVLEALTSFLPGLLFPKIYETTCSSGFFAGGSPADYWQAFLPKVIDAAVANEVGSPLQREVSHA
jgi:nucleoside-diphosphate-sugar epimerase